MMVKRAACHPRTPRRRSLWDTTIPRWVLRTRANSSTGGTVSARPRDMVVCRHSHLEIRVKRVTAQNRALPSIAACRMTLGGPRLVSHTAAIPAAARFRRHQRDRMGNRELRALDVSRRSSPLLGHLLHVFSLRLLCFCVECHRR
jgi:hypothetical protein